ncbi:MAG: OsmC family peroxiredoxin [Calditrichaeota bacterium]|nr:MAG: OsmC family peroxiredoxin [Calditrichota bacterium]
MAEEGKFSMNLEQINNYEFEVKFDWENVAPILMDEPEPLGQRKGPNAARLLGAAVGNCLSASLLFCLQKAKVEVGKIKTEVNGTIRRNEQGRWRVTQIDVHIVVDIGELPPQRVSRCVEIFEDYCVVTGSVRKGIAVNVKVSDQNGNLLYENNTVPQ